MNTTRNNLTALRGLFADLREKFATTGIPVLSIDTKKKERIGNFKRDGKGHELYQVIFYLTTTLSFFFEIIAFYEYSVS